jgi:phosphoribosylformylglycinamidine cyclo-ligase
MNDLDPVLREKETPLRDAYACAGVDIAAGNAAVARYRVATADWRHPNQVGTIGGFSGLFRLPGDERRALVASTDGVGTKILIAAELRRYDSVGRDLVNHCVNDILVVNASPLFFLDYLAVGKLDPEVAGEIVGGVQAGCRAHACAVLGGETAEMPGLYRQGHFDLAGTIVGIVDESAIPDPQRVEPGDAILGLPSVGLHTNGYSLARALIPREEWLQPFPAAGDGLTYADALLAEHPSYYAAVRAIQATSDVKAMAHITGGGLLDNVPRTLPPSCKALFDQSCWTVPPLLAELVRRGELGFEERYRTLNMGIGMTLIVPKEQVERALEAQPAARLIGRVERRTAEEPAVIVRSGGDA